MLALNYWRIGKNKKTGQVAADVEASGKTLPGSEIVGGIRIGDSERLQ